MKKEEKTEVGGLHYEELLQKEAKRTAGKLRQRALELKRLREIDVSKQEELEKELLKNHKDRPMIPVADWLENPFFVGGLAGAPGKGGLFDKLKEHIVTIFEGDEASKNRPYFEVIFGGGIGYGKTTCARAIALRCLYELSCKAIPQYTLGNMTEHDSIVFMNFNTKVEKARKTFLNAFRKLIDTVPYFREEFIPRKGVTRYIDFPKNLRWEAAGCDVGDSLGENLHFAAMDEANFYPMIEDSTRAHNTTGKFDAADILYDALWGRIINRYGKPDGSLPRTSHLLIISQATYPDAFVERRLRAAQKKDAERLIYAIRHTEWETRGKSFYVKGWFYAAAAPAGRRPVMYKKTEPGTPEAEEWKQDHEADGFNVISIPRNYLDAAEKDIDDALRTLAGIATHAITPFITDPESIPRVVLNREIRIRGEELPNVLMRHPMTAETTTLTDGVKIIPEMFAMFVPERERWQPLCCPRMPRYIHFDGALGRKDFAGVCMGHIHDRIQISRMGAHHGEDGKPVTNLEWAPMIWSDLLVQVAAPRGEDIDLELLRSLVLQLGGYGFRIARISYDGWAGTAESQQQLEMRGYEVNIVSLDRTSAPYKMLRLAMKEGRLLQYEYMPWVEEMQKLEYSQMRDRINHSPNGHKDISDAVAAVVFQCETHGMDENSLLTPEARRLSVPRRQVPGGGLRQRINAQDLYVVNPEQPSTATSLLEHQRMKRRREKGRRKEAPEIESMKKYKRRRPLSGRLRRNSEQEE